MKFDLHLAMQQFGFRNLWRQGCDFVVSLLVAAEFMKKFGIMWKILKNEHLVKIKPMLNKHQLSFQTIHHIPRI
jgi:hypothetical protein